MWYLPAMSNNLWIVGLMVLGGALMSMQAPINAALRLHVGVLESALVSFSVGTLALILLVAFAGKGSLLGLRQAAPWQLSGGLIGVLFVTATLVAAPKIGMTGVIVSALAGQALGGLLIDSFGWFGLEARAIDLRRVAGVGLLGAAVWLLNARPDSVK